MASVEILERIAALVRAREAEISHIDGTVVAEAPRLAAHVGEMRERLSRALGVEIGQVSVKATSNEGLDATGRGDAIAAHAIATVRQPRA
jgi:2-C-methyl-D-erythritol 2,4-cyclodiphosphate synthase